MSVSPMPKPGRGQVAMRDTSGQDRVIEPGRRLPVRALAGGAGLAALAVAAAFLWSHWSAAERSFPAERYRTATVQRGDFVRDVSVQGLVVAAVSPTVFAPAAGTVTLIAQAGDAVEAGQVIARIDSPDMANRLAQEEATLHSVEADLEFLRIELRQRELAARQSADLARVRITAAERELRRAEASRSHQVISEQDYEKARDDLETAELEYAHAMEDAELVRDAAKVELRTRSLQRDRQRLLVEDLRRQVDELTIRSPVTGMIGNLAVSQKAAVLANQPLFTVVDLSEFEVEIAVPEAYADDLGLGMAVNVRYGTETYPGVVSAVSPEVSNNQVLGRVRFEGEPPPGLRQNQRVSATVLLERKPDTLFVQRGAFFESGAGRIAYVVEEGIASRRAIETGSVSVNAVEVLGGLEEGERIVVSSFEEFGDAATVRLVD